MYTESARFREYKPGSWYKICHDKAIQKFSKANFLGQLWKILSEIQRLRAAGFRGGICNPSYWGAGTCGWSEFGRSISMFLCRLGVRTKAGVNMDSGWELPQSRLTKETRNGPGEKSSSQKCPPQFSSGTAPMSGKLTSCPVNLTKPSSYFGYNFSS